MKSDSNKNIQTPNGEINKSRTPSRKAASPAKQHSAAPRDGSSSAALKELAENYHTILENSLNGTVVVDAATAKILFANKAALKMHGFNSLEEVAEANLLDYIHPDDKERTFLAFLKDFFENTSHEQYEFRTISKDGTEKRVLSYSVPIQYQNKLCGVISFIDITERKKMEDALRASEEKLRAMFESMSEAATITDMRGRIIDANPAAVRLHRYLDKKELIGISAAELVADRDRERAIKDSIEALKTKQTKLTEYKLTTKGGTLIDGEFCTAVIRDSSGNPCGFIGISRDISSRKRMEEQLRESERKLETIFNSIMDGLIITDMMGTVMDANEAAVRIGKYNNLKDLIGRSGMDFITEGDRKRVSKALLAAIADTKKVHSDIIEYIAKDKNGNPFYGETSAAAIRDSSGKPTGMIFVTRDVSERKRIEDALRQSEEKFRALTEETNDILYSADAAGTILYIGPQVSRYDMDHEKMAGKNFLDVVHPDDREPLMKEFIKTMNTGKEFPSQFRILDGKGNTHWLEEIGRVRRDTTGAPIGTTGVLRDITERKRIEEKLRNSEEELRTFFDSIRDGIIITDLNAKVVNVNNAMLQIGHLGNKEDVIGNVGTKWVTEEDKERVQKELTKQLGKRGYSDVVEYKAICPDGTTYLAETSAVLRRNSAGKAEGIVFITRDITERKRLEDKIRGDKEQLSAMFEAITSGICVTDIQGNVTEVNAAMVRLSGCSTRDELIGKNALGFIAAKDRNIAAQRIAKRVAVGHGTDTSEYIFVTKDGREFAGELSIGMIRDKEGKPISIVAIARDITKRKKAEEALRESEEKYREVVERANDGIVILQDVIIQYANPRVAEIAGYKPEEILGTSMANYIHPDELSKVMERYKQRLGGEAVPQIYETALLHKNGRKIEVELNAGVITYQGKSANMVIIRNITERKQAEQALRASEERYRLLAENVSDVIWIMDMNLRFTYIGPSVFQLRGYTAEEAIKQSLQETATPATLETLTNIFKDELLSEEAKTRDPHRTRTFTAELKHKNGTTVWTEQKICFLLDQNNTPLGILGVTRDITERKRADEVLRASEERYRLLAENISDVIFIIDLDFKFLYLSPSVYQLRGYTVEEAMQIPIEKTVTPASLEQVTKTMLEQIALLKSGKRDPHEAHTIELEEYRKDGSTVWVEMKLNGIYDKDGNLTSLLGVTRDITVRKRVNEIIRAKEQELRSIFESMSDCLVITDEQLHIVNVNDGASQMTGFTREELIGRNALDVLDKDELGRAIKSLENRMQKGLLLEREDFKIRIKDGSLRDVNINISNLNDASGNPKGFVCVIRDITERKQVDDALRKNEEMLRVIFDSMQDSIVITDKDTNIVQCNNILLGTFGFTRDQIIGHPWSDIIADKNSGSSLELIAQRFNGQATTAREYYSIKIPDGTIRHAEMSVGSLKDTAGNVTGFVAVLRDVTERKRVEDALRSSEERLRAVFESMHDGIAIVDKDIKFVQWNQAVLDIAGFTAEEMLGKSGIDIVIPEDRPRVMEELAKQFMGTAAERQSYRVQLPGGILKHIELSVSALKDDAGDITGFVASIRDVTRRIAMERELKKALDDLQRSNKELEQFAYVASHDLQEPLRMISSYTQLISKRYKGKLDTDADEFIGFAVDGADRMQKMIQDLLAYSRVTTRGKDFEPVDLEKAFNDAIDNLKIAIEDNKAIITHDPLPKVLADESQMIRLFQNLLGNALKFHGAKPTVIHVGCKDGAADYTISIKDNGIGIDKQYFNRLFIIFQRLHTRDQYPGTGIGLAVCKRTVERHGGTIWVESEGDGKGSTFVFTIPKRDLTKKMDSAKSLVENS